MFHSFFSSSLVQILAPGPACFHHVSGFMTRPLVPLDRRSLSLTLSLSLFFPSSFLTRKRKRGGVVPWDRPHSTAREELSERSASFARELTLLLLSLSPSIPLASSYDPVCPLLPPLPPSPYASANQFAVHLINLTWNKRCCAVPAKGIYALTTFNYF